MKRFEVIGTDCEPDSWIDNTDQIKGVFEHETIEKILDEWDERIKFLEKENKKLKSACEYAIKSYNKIGTLYDLKCKQLELREEENERLRNKVDAFNYAKHTVDYWACRDKKVEELKEQLTNAIVPKHKLNEEVYIIDHNEVKHCIITCVSLCSDGVIRYDVEDMNDQSGGYWTLKDNDLYDSEEEAKKHLEGRK